MVERDKRDKGMCIVGLGGWVSVPNERPFFSRHKGCPLE